MDIVERIPETTNLFIGKLVGVVVIPTTSGSGSLRRM